LTVFRELEWLKRIWIKPLLILIYLFHEVFPLFDLCYIVKDVLLFNFLPLFESEHLLHRFAVNVLFAGLLLLTEDYSMFLWLVFYTQLLTTQSLLPFHVLKVWTHLIILSLGLFLKFQVVEFIKRGRHDRDPGMFRVRVDVIVLIENI